MELRRWLTRRLSIAAGAAAVLVCVCLSSAPPAFATCTFTHYAVTTQADDTTPGDGLLSLREAISEGGTVPCAIIELPAGHYPITVAGGGTIQITAHNSLRVQPQSPVATARDVVIEGDESHPLFHIGATEEGAEFERLTLTDGGAGALVNEGGVNLTGVTVAGNRRSEFGGGLHNSAGAQIQMQDSTISNNMASAAHSPAGGGIYNEGRLVVTDSTISGNTAAGDEAAGGGIYNAGEAQLFNTTVDRNTASGSRAIAGDVDTTGAATTLTGDSLFGGGSPENCNSGLTPELGDHSISSDSSCVATVEDPKLGPLQNNGGGTDTEMLLPGSPAIDVSSAPCPDSFDDQDQRGVSKPQGSLCDVGAYELVQSADLGVSGSVAPDPVSQGSIAAFTFEVASTAPSFDPSLAEDAVQPTLTDVLPAGLRFVSGSPGCSANGQTVTCSLGALADNAGPSAVMITARALGLGSISNTATVSSPRPDSNPGDDSATVTVTSKLPIALPSPPLTAVIVPPAPLLGLSAVGETARTWLEGSAAAKISSAKHALPIGTTFSFTLNEAARVTFAFTTPAPGRRVGKACVAPAARNKYRHRCTRTIRAGTLTFGAHRAVNKLRFEGLISRHHKLNPGSCTLTITATAAGQHAVSATLHFTIAKAPPRTKHH